MRTLFSSASKIVFILMTVALISLTWKGVVDAKDFTQLVSMAFVYYFTRPNQTIQAQNTNNLG